MLCDCLERVNPGRSEDPEMSDWNQFQGEANGGGVWFAINVPKPQVSQLKLDKQPASVGVCALVSCVV